jgi:predicted lipoprotein
MKKLLGVFAILLLLTSPAAMAEESPNGWVEDVATDFGTDSYDEDGCFC